MSFFNQRRGVLVLAAALLAANAMRAQEPTPTPTPAATPTVEELARRIDVLTQELEALKLGEAGNPAAQPERQGVHGLGPAASKVYRVKSGLSIGGYGEWLYQNFSRERDDDTPSGAVDEWDNLRAVLYLGWKFSPRFVLNSEIEFEHGSTERGGAVSVEFANIDALLRKEVNLRAGVVLAPVGLMNELHEPPVYLGTRRPEVERVIIPSTWGMNAVGAFGEAGPITYKLYLGESLDASHFDAEEGIREGRQGGGEAKVDDLAVTGRLDYLGFPGLLAGASFFTGNTGQDLTVDGRGIGARTTLFDLHADYRWRGLWLRALYARARVSDVDLLNRALGLEGEDSIGERLDGWYLQAGYDVWPLFGSGTSMALTPYLRHERFDTQARVPAGYVRNPEHDRRITTFGLDYKPLSNLVLKVDYQDHHNAAGTGVNQWNVSLGYLF